MRRTASALVIILMVLAIGTPAASAEAAVARVDTGTFDGTSVYELFVEECPFVHQVFTGTYDPDRRGARSGSYQVDVCVEQPNADFNHPLSGTFEIVTGHGYSLDGTVTGLFNPNMPVATIDATLTVTASPGSRHPIRGTITITGTSDQHDPQAPDDGSVDAGTFSADLRRVPPG